MSLKWKINLILAWSFGLLALTIYGVQRLIVYPSFVQLENAQAIEEMNRCVDSIRREVDQLSVVCADWSAWDDAYKFAKDRNEPYERANLLATSFASNRIDFSAYLDTNRKVVWSGAPDATYGKVEPAKEFVAELLGVSKLLPRSEADANSSGLLLTSRGPMLICTRPILTSSKSGPSVGYLIMGRKFGSAEIASLAERTRVAFKAEAIEPLNAQQRTALASLADHSVMVERNVPDKTSVMTVFPALDGTPALLLRAELPASISAHGALAMRISVVTTLMTGAVVVLLMMYGIHLGVVRPLLKVTAHAVAVGSTGDLSAQLGMTRSDEIGALARELDRMVEHIAATRNSQLDIAHRAGMAEIASEVLHNVGNALNTVNTSTQILGDKLRKSKVGGLSKAANMLSEHKTDLATFFTSDQRSGKLVDYLIDLSSACNSEQESMLQEVSTLKSRIEHMNDVISLQQSYATHTELLQKLSVTKLLDDAVAMHAELFALYDVRVERQYESIPAIAVNKSKVMQVLMNLVKNGVESMISAGQPEPTMTLAARIEGEKLIVEVTDTGMGIDPANVGSLFRSGFTTKPNGHGFGLHFCANTISAMSGSLTASSAGVGKGATFRIELPSNLQEVHT